MRHILITEDEASILAGILDSGGYSVQEAAIFDHLRSEPVDVQAWVDTARPMKSPAWRSIVKMLQKLIDNAGHTKH